MRSKGNGNVDVCANNLLAIHRGENPFERVKGLNPRSIDRPLLDARAEILQDAEWCIETYEPRGTLKNITVEGLDSPSGDFRVSAQIAES